MCDAGRIKHHLKHNLWRADATILFVGYQAIGTLGRRILDRAKHVKIFGEEINVNAHVEYIEGFSGHADQEGLLEWIGHIPTSVQKVFVMHGEEKVTEIFAGELKARGYNATAPNLFDVFETSDLEVPAAVHMAKAAPQEDMGDLVTKVARQLDTADASKAAEIRRDLMALIEKWDKQAG